MTLAIGYMRLTITWTPPKPKIDRAEQELAWQRLEQEVDQAREEARRTFQLTAYGTYR
ncbi:MAG: hypothetical protein ACOY93_10640 [Bacillota bacterium]